MFFTEYYIPLLSVLNVLLHLRVLKQVRNVVGSLSAQTQEASPPPPSYTFNHVCMCVCVCARVCACVYGTFHMVYTLDDRQSES